jgi:hypothetical protein
MKRHELAKVLLDEIVRTRALLARLQMVLARRTEEKISRVDQCEECERLWQAYESATIQSVQLYRGDWVDDPGPESPEVERNDNQG